MFTIRDRLKRPTTREFIERRQFTVNLVILPLWLPWPWHGCLERKVRFVRFMV
jgi:hypothetical protein